MEKRPLTPAYVFFYILFWPDTWRILIGLLVSGFLSPLIMPPDLSTFVTGFFYFMVACIGYTVAAVPARGISRFLRKWVLKNR